MTAKQRRWDRPVASIEEMIRAVRQESAAALSTAGEFFPDAPMKQTLQLPRRFPVSGRPSEDPARGPRDEAAEGPEREDLA